ncbi:MAG: hypothetical protein Q9160_001028 [Pyrenula sp. 1 TL-2023]
MLLPTALAVLTFLHTSYASTSVLLPLYIYPSLGEDLWAPVISAITTYPSLTFQLIINPKDGPLKTKDDDYKAYAAAMTLLRQAATTHDNTVFLGYVKTGYGSRSSTDVQADVDGWTLYPELLPNGIFFDETSDTAAQSSYYESLVSYTKTKIGNAFTVLNPGTVPAPDYFPFADQVVIHEIPATTDALEGLSDVDASKFSALLYSVGSDTYLKGNVTEVKNAGYGSAYVTDSASWDKLGSNWPSFVQALNG